MSSAPEEEPDQDAVRHQAADPPVVEVFTGPESAFFATSSLVLGARSAILVDAQLTRSAGRELAEWVAGKGRSLAAIVITHPHADHYFGAEEVLRLFPGASLYAVPEVVRAITGSAMAKVREWKPLFGDDITDRPVVPQPLPDRPLVLEGSLVRVLAFGQGDCAESTAVHIPAARTVVAGDLVYSGTHLRTSETTRAQRREWLRSLGRLATLGTDRIVAGHLAPGGSEDAATVLSFTAEYLQDFDRFLAQHPGDPAGLIAAVVAKYGELTLPTILESGAAANSARAAAGEEAGRPHGEEQARPDETEEDPPGAAG